MLQPDFCHFLGVSTHEEPTVLLTKIMIDPEPTLEFQGSSLSYDRNEFEIICKRAK